MAVTLASRADIKPKFEELSYFMLRKVMVQVRVRTSSNRFSDLSACPNLNLNLLSGR